jgi:hypothetical protein
VPRKSKLKLSFFFPPKTELYPIFKKILPLKKKKIVFQIFDIPKSGPTLLRSSPFVAFGRESNGERRSTLLSADNSRMDMANTIQILFQTFAILCRFGQSVGFIYITPFASIEKRKE